MSNEAIEFYKRLKAFPQCPLCGKVFKSLKGLSEHLRGSHCISLNEWLSINYPNYCKICGIQIQTEKASLTHKSMCCSLACNRKASSVSHKIRIANEGPPFKGEKHPLYGKKRPPEVIEKMRAARRGKKNPKHSAWLREWYRHNSHAMKGKKHSQGSIENFTGTAEAKGELLGGEACGFL